MSTEKIISSKEIYVNPFTDFGFKLLFGEEPNKALLIDFLNEVLRNDSGRITDITYLNTEQLGQTEEDRRAIFDIYCENEKQEKFIVELQKAKQEFFKDRALYYTSSAIQKQAKKGTKWNFELQAVYTIAILDFEFESDHSASDAYRTDVRLINEKTGEVFYEKLKFIYFEMPKFSKSLDELEDRYEKWLYVLRHLHYLESIPAKLQDRIFRKLFEVAEVAKFNTEQMESYQHSIKVYRDLQNSLDTAEAKGEKRGHAKGLKEGEKNKSTQIALNFLQMGMSVSDIAKGTGLSEEEIESIQKEQGN